MLLQWFNEYLVSFRQGKIKQDSFNLSPSRFWSKVFIVTIFIIFIGLNFVEIITGKCMYWTKSVSLSFLTRCHQPVLHSSQRDMQGSHQNSGCLSSLHQAVPLLTHQPLLYRWSLLPICHALTTETLCFVLAFSCFSCACAFPYGFLRAVA